MGAACQAHPSTGAQPLGCRTTQSARRAGISPQCTRFPRFCSLKAALLYWLTSAAVILTVLAGSALFGADDAPIDPVRGRALMQKSQRGETLTPEESAYLERVRTEIRRRIAQKRGTAPPAADTAPAVRADWSGLVPLTDLTNT
jgi:hypothetical protein